MMPHFNCNYVNDNTLEVVSDLLSMSYMQALYQGCVSRDMCFAFFVQVNVKASQNYEDIYCVDDKKSHWLK